MRLIEFIKDFATKKEGDVWECTNPLANKLVRIRKVAKFVKEEQKKKPGRPAKKTE